jgi:DNA polymerase III epsilon subunit-like protein
MKKENLKNYIVWDLETSGLNPEKDKILEIGAIVIRDGNIVKEFSALLNHKIDIDPVITNLTGLTKEKLEAEGRDPKEVIGEFIGMLQEEEMNVTHNGFRFDIPFLKAQTFAIMGTMEPDQWDRLNAFFHKLFMNGIDTAAIYKGKKMGMNRMIGESFLQYANRALLARVYGLKYNVGICCDELGVDRSQITQHRAGGDIILTNEIFKKLVEIPQSLFAMAVEE